MIRISLSGSFSLLEQFQRASDVKSNEETLYFPQQHLVGYGLQTGLVGFSYADTE